MPNPALIKAAAVVLSDERGRKGVGWIIVAILSPVILLLALLCSLGSGASSHNASVAELCFNGGTLPANTPPEYAACIEDMRGSFALLDSCILEINGMTEELFAPKQHATRAQTAVMLKRVYDKLNPAQ